MIAKNFDTPEKRRRCALRYSKRFGWVRLSDGEERNVVSIKDEGTNLYKHIKGMISIEYDPVGSKITTALFHPVKGFTKMERQITTKNMLKCVYGDPRYHTGQKAVYLKS